MPRRKLSINLRATGRHAEDVLVRVTSEHNNRFIQIDPANEESSRKAFNMEDGGARHMFNVFQGLQYQSKRISDFYHFMSADLAAAKAWVDGRDRAEWRTELARFPGHLGDRARASEYRNIAATPITAADVLSISVLEISAMYRSEKRIYVQKYSNPITGREVTIVLNLSDIFSAIRASGNDLGMFSTQDIKSYVDSLDTTDDAPLRDRLNAIKRKRDSEMLAELGELEEFKRAHADVNNNALSGAGAVVWRDIPRQALIVACANANAADKEFNYAKQLIIQLSGDEIGQEAAKHLFLKHPRGSEWMQLRDGIPSTSVGWNGTAVTDIPTLRLEADGRIRIVLVGHGTRDTDGTTRFGGKTAAELRAHLATVFSGLDAATRRRLKGVHLDLVGCELIDSNIALERTLPGQLAAWLGKQTRSMNIDAANVSVSARKYQVRVTANGRKEILYRNPSRLNEPASWVSQDAVRLRDDANKVEIRIDPNTRRPVLQPRTSQELFDLRRDVDQAWQQAKGSTNKRGEARALRILRDTVSNRVRTQLLEQPGFVTTQRTVAEQWAGEQVRTLDLGKTYELAIAALRRRDATLDADWVATFETDVRARVRFLNQKTGATRWVSSGNQNLVEVCRHFKELNRRLGQAVQLDAQGRVRVKAKAGTTGAMSALNAAFLIYAITQHQDTSDLSAALRVGAYINLVQPALNTADNVVDVVGLALRNGSRLASNVLRGVGAVLQGVGVALDFVNLGITGYGYHNAETPAQRRILRDQLILSITQTVQGVGLLVASFAIGGPASIAVGLASALPQFALQALISHFIVPELGRIAVAHNLYKSWMESVETPGLRQQADGMWSLHQDAVVDTIDFRGGTLSYSNRLEANVEGSHHFISSGDDERLSITIYEALMGGNKIRRIDNALISSNNASFILPSAPAQRVVLKRSKTQGYLPKTKKNLRKPKRIDLPGNNRVYDLLAPHGIRKYMLAYEARVLVSQTVTVTLDEKPRGIVVPHILDGEVRRALAYELRGNGGQYALTLSPWAVDIAIHTDNSAQTDTWIIHIDTQVRSLTNRLALEGGTASTLEFGALRAGAFDQIAITSTTVTIGAQVLNFANARTARPVLVYNDDAFKVLLSIDLAQQIKQAVLQLHSWPPTAAMVDRIHTLLQQNSSLLGADGGLPFMLEGNRVGQYRPSSGEWSIVHDEHLRTVYQWNSTAREMQLKSVLINQAANGTSVLTDLAALQDVSARRDMTAWSALSAYRTQIGAVSPVQDLTIIKVDAAGDAYQVRFRAGRPAPLESLSFTVDGVNYRYSLRLGLVVIATGERVTLAADRLVPVLALASQPIVTLGLAATVRQVRLGNWERVPLHIILPTQLDTPLVVELEGALPEQWHWRADGSLWAGSVESPTLRFSVPPGSATRRQLLERVMLRSRGVSGQVAASTLYQLAAAVTASVIDGLRLEGSGESDELSGGPGTDALFGHAGDDVLHGRAGADRLDGGIGIDTANYAESSAGVTVDLSQTSAQQGGDAQGDVLMGIENLVGSAYDDVLTGNALDNRLSGGAGDDFLRGEKGNDVLEGGLGNDILQGGRGADILDGGEGRDTASYANSTGGVRIIMPRISGRENTQSYGDAEGDVLRSIENLVGSAYDDGLTGSADDNVISGGAGDDYLAGLAGNNILNGDAGDDNLEGGEGADTLNGGEGEDTAYYLESRTGVRVDLASRCAQRGGHAEGDVLNSIENLYGSYKDDFLYGNSEDNTLRGHDGDDILVGRLGNDILGGGMGNDTYLFNFSRDGHDRIDSFDTGANKQDTLRVTGIYAAEMELLRDGQDLVIQRKNNSNHSVRVRQHFAGRGWQVDRIVFADEANVTYDAQRIGQLAKLIQGISSMPAADGQRSDLSRGLPARVSVDATRLTVALS